MVSAEARTCPDASRTEYRRGNRNTGRCLRTFTVTEIEQSRVVSTVMRSDCTALPIGSAIDATRRAWMSPRPAVTYNARLATHKSAPAIAVMHPNFRLVISMEPQLERRTGICLQHRALPP